MAKTAAGTEAVEYLQRGIASLLGELEQADFWQAVNSPDTDPLLVREVMKQIYLEIQWYQPDVIEATIAAIGQLPRSLSAKRIRTMLIHQAEEWDHGEMAVRDYVALGGDEQEARSSRMSVTAFATAAFWRMLAHKRDSFAYLGALYLFEGLTPIVTGRVKGQLSEQGIPDNALEYIEFHSTEDLKHAKVVDHLIAEVVSEFPQCVEAVKFGFNAFRHVYPLPGWSAAYQRGLASYERLLRDRHEITAAAPARR
jgi:hypothetical protein